MNGILIVDKPAGWTSHDVVAKLRGALKEKRVGHGGTLDPMATGVLPVFVGKATKAAQFAENAEKEYIAGLRLGISTDTQDITGTVTEEREVTVTETDLLALLPRFLGEQEQLPPMYSAIKVDGQPLYKLARRGVEARRQPRRISISRLEYLGREGENYRLRVACSKGTYIRTLCADLGDELGCGGAMSSLRRVRAGRYTLEEAHSLEELLSAAKEGRMEEYLLPVDSLFSDLPAVTATVSQEKKIRNGVSIPWEGEGRLRVYGQKGEFLMVAQARNGVLQSIKNFFEG